MIDLGRETNGNNEMCLGVRFALCIITLLVISLHARAQVMIFSLKASCLMCSHNKPVFMILHVAVSLGT